MRFVNFMCLHSLLICVDLGKLHRLFLLGLLQWWLRCQCSECMPYVVFTFIVYTCQHWKVGRFSVRKRGILRVDSLMTSRLRANSLMTQNAHWFWTWLVDLVLRDLGQARLACFKPVNLDIAYNAWMLILVAPLGPWLILLLFFLSKRLQEREIIRYFC